MNTSTTTLQLLEALQRDPQATQTKKLARMEAVGKAWASPWCSSPAWAC